jgi:hypothetical protein
MIKSEGRIVTEIYRHIVTTSLAAAITGKVHKSTDREPNSVSEDIVIKALANSPKQVQQTIVNVNIYVPDNLDDGQYVKNGARCDQLEEIACNDLEVFWIGPARVHLEEQHTYKVEDARCHVINCRMIYQIENS